MRARGLTLIEIVVVVTIAVGVAASSVVAITGSLRAARERSTWELLYDQAQALRREAVSSGKFLHYSDDSGPPGPLGTPLQPNQIRVGVERGGCTQSGLDEDDVRVLTFPIPVGAGSPTAGSCFGPDGLPHVPGFGVRETDFRQRPPLMQIMHQVDGSFAYRGTPGFALPYVDDVGLRPQVSSD